MHSRIQHQHCTSSRCAVHLAPVLPAPCATRGCFTGSAGRQQQQQQGSGDAALRPGAGSGRTFPSADGSSSNAQQQQPNHGQQQQLSFLDSTTPNLQYPADDVYVAEPWEISEPWDEASNRAGSAPGPYTQPQQQQQGGPGAAVELGRVASGGQQGSPLGPLDWLLEDEEGEAEGSKGDSDEDDGWLLDQPGSSEDLQQQDVKQQWQPLQQQQQPPAPAVPVDLQASWEAALAVSLDVLATYDVRYDVTRPARISSSAATGRVPGLQQPSEGGLGPEELSLTAAAVAAARARRRRRRPKAPATPLLQASQQLQQALPLAAGRSAEAGAGADSLQQQDLWQQQQQQQEQQQYVGGAAALLEEVPLPEDARWLAVSRAHAAYLSYMQQLAAMAVNKQQQQHQLVYQVGISDSWVQLSHLVKVFGGRELTPPVVAAMWKRLAAVINRKVFVRMSHAERCHYDAFIERLAAQSITTLQIYSSDDTASTAPSSSSNSSSLPPVGYASSSRSSAGGRSSIDADAAAGSINRPVLPANLAATAYGMAVLGVRNEQLAAAVVEACARLLTQAANAAAAAADGMSSSWDASVSGSSSNAAGRSSTGAAGGGVWGPGEVSSLMWGLGTVGYSPPAEWLQDMQAVSRELMPRCQPPQLWGVLWGFAQFRHPPDESWMASWLAASQQQLDGFNAEGLAHSIWALAMLGHVPHKLWLRAYCGMVAYKIKSFVAGQLAMVLPALSTLGYKPRPELRRTIAAQVRRNMHTYSPSQLVSVLSAMASYPPGEGEPASMSGWHPGRLFLYDFITHSAPRGVLTEWSGRQAAQVLWAFSRFRYIPDRSYLLALLSHLQTQLTLCDADALSMTVWALAALRQPLPSADWGAQWCDAALGVADAFGPQALAHGLSGMAALRVQPPGQLMQALTLSASGCLSSFSCMELGLMIAALADLHWRPSNAWMTAFVSQVSQQLPAFENEDYGLLLYGLASLAQPLHPKLLARFCREAQRKLSGLSGEGLGLLVWGLAQYGFDEMPDAQSWWSDVFAECSVKWSTAGLRGCALAALGLAQLGPRYLPPGDWESDWVARYRVLVSAKPASWEELVVGFRAAAGLEPSEVLPDCPWLCGLLLQVGKSWGLRLSEGQQGAGVLAIAAVIDGVNVRMAATAAFMSQAAEVGVGDSSAGVGAAVDGSGLGEGLPYRDVEPTSATAVLL